MSYVSLLKNIPEFLSQPTGIAALASVGIHGAIAFILPLMPIDSKPKQQVAPGKTVGLVELNQAEQNRLPQASPPQVALQPVPLRPQVPPLPNIAYQQTTLPPLPPASSTQLIIPPLPKSSTNLSISSLPKGQSLGILPKRDLQINPINSSLNLRTPAEQPLPRYNDNVKLGESKPLPPSNVPELQVANTPAQVQPTNVPELQLAKTSTGTPTSKLPNLLAAKEPADLQTVPSSIPNNTTPTATGYGNTTPPTVGSESGVTKVAQNQQLITPIGGTVQSTDKLALAGSSLLAAQLQSTPRIPELPSTSRESGIAKISTFGEQFNQVKRQYPILETKLPIFATINANAGSEGKVEGGLIVDAEGKVELLNFLDNSISSDRRTAAREYLREHFQNNPIQATGKPKYYPFSLSFRSNSSSPEVVKQISPRQSPIGTKPANSDASSSVTNQKQALSEPRQRLIQRLRLSPGGTQPSYKPQTSLSESLHQPQVNTQPLQQQRPLGGTSAATPQPLPEQRVRNSQPALAKETPAKPLPEQRVRNNQEAPTPEATPKPASGGQVSSNQPNTAAESGQKLLQRLRQLREERQNSHQEQ